MRVNVSIILFLFNSAILCAQSKSYSIPRYNNGDTSFWYRVKEEGSNKIGLVDLLQSKDSLHFRFWAETQIIDIWSSDLISFKGQLINFTKSLKNKKQDEEFYYQITPLDTVLTQLIFKLFEEREIFKIPTEDSIKGWRPGLDGSTYFIEYSSKTSYSFKTYWTPSYFSDLKEAVTLQSLIVHLFTELKIKDSWYTFVRSLPIGCYNAGGTSMFCPKLKSMEVKKRYYN